jgi:hypothetical protein
MAEVYNVGFKTLVKIQKTGVLSDALSTLGYTVGGVNIIENVYHSDIQNDEDGGPEGPPADVQIMGQIDYVQLVLNKYDAAVWTVLCASTPGGTQGLAPTPGTLMLQSGNYWRLLLVGTNFTRNYTRVIIREPRQLSVGSKHSVAILTAQCFRDPNSSPTANRLWNTTAS